MALSSTSDIILMLQSHFSGTINFRHSLTILATAAAVSPLLYRHFQQRHLPQQPTLTAWLTTAKDVIASFDSGEEDTEGSGLTEEEKDHIIAQLPEIAEFLDWGQQTDATPLTQFMVMPPPILLTQHETCQRCIVATGRPPRLFRECCNPITVIGPDFKKRMGYLVVATCHRCHSHYYPNIISVKQAGSQDRVQKLEHDPEWLCISKNGLWAHRKVATLQEDAILEFRGSFQRFHLFFNKAFGDGAKLLTERQTHRLFAEHFVRVLLHAHGSLSQFECPAFASPAVLIQAALQILGQNGGVVPGAKDHECNNCMHEKRYATSLQTPEDSDRASQVAGVDDEMSSNTSTGTPTPDALLSQQPPDDGEIGYTQAAVMDGKTLVHHGQSTVFKLCSGLVEFQLDGASVTTQSHLVKYLGFSTKSSPLITLKIVPHSSSMTMPASSLPTLSLKTPSPFGLTQLVSLWTAGITSIIKLQINSVAPGATPAPADGSQPDLVITQTDREGNTHTIRAYNTETAEQLNSWLNGFEAAMRQMTNWNFDFFMHVLMYLYMKSVVAKVAVAEESDCDDDDE
ncbi:hypothetical protein FRC01_004014 [Tulasnella sp. 417]|nr:hypothetical protein FRC01_004014 [Tulasnella sp. 417]